MQNLFVSLLAVAALLPMIRAGDAANDPPPAVSTAPTPTPENGRHKISIAKALEDLQDVDQETRQRALARFAEADAGDVPSLEQFADSKDAGTRIQVAQLLKRLKRGAIAFRIKYLDGKPIQNSEFKVQIWPPGADAGNDTPWQTVIDRNLCTDENGSLLVGKFNNGKYNCLVKDMSKIPQPIFTTEFQLLQHTQPIEITFRRGVSVKVTVLNEADVPIPGVTVAPLFTLPNVQALRESFPMDRRVHLPQWLTTTNQEGVAVFPNLHGSPVGLAALADGYDLAISGEVKIQDGGTGAITLKLAKTKPPEPVTFTLSVRDKKNGGIPLVNLRLLMITRAVVRSGTVIGPNWCEEVNAKSIDTYIKGGALDAGTAGESGSAKIEAPPDQYFFLGFFEGRVYFSDNILDLSAKNNTPVVSLVELPQR